jgi:hypothetical protein
MYHRIDFKYSYQIAVFSMIIQKYLINYDFQLPERQQSIGPYRAHLKSYHYHPILLFDILSATIWSMLRAALVSLYILNQEGISPIKYAGCWVQMSLRCHERDIGGVSYLYVQRD